MINSGEVFNYILNKQPGHYISLPLGNGKIWLENNWFENAEDAREFVNANSGQFNAYYAVTRFKTKKRTKNNAENSCFLYADLDTCRVEDIPEEIRPTIVIESSPGRLQGLWEVDCALAPEEYSRMNKLIAYGLASKGADKSGWDVTQVLRAPGSLNHKYDEPKEVKVVSFDRVAYSATDLGAFLEREYAASLPAVAVVEGLGLSDEAFKLIYRGLSRDVIQRLFRESPSGYDDRSEVMFWAACRMLETGLLPYQVIETLIRSNWNKFSGRDDEYLRLEEILGRAMSRVGEQVTEISTDVASDNGPIELRELLRSTIPRQEWIIKNFIKTNGFTIIAAKSKSLKSTLVLDLAHSIATGLPFLNLEPVDNRYTGNVLYISFEGGLGLIQERISRIVSFKDNRQFVVYRNGKLHCTFRDTRDDFKLYFYENPNLNLATDEGKEWVESEIARLGIHTLIIDPAYLAFLGIDMNKAESMLPHLNWLKNLSIRGVCRDVIVIHHFNKAGNDRDGMDKIAGVSEWGQIHSTFIAITKKEPTKKVKDSKAAFDPTVKFARRSILDANDTVEELQEYVELQIDVTQRGSGGLYGYNFVLFPGGEGKPLRVIKDNMEAVPIPFVVQNKRQQILAIIEKHAHLSNARIAKMLKIPLQEINSLLMKKGQ
jgi:AAA domain/RepB DNA-primase from phage plasmid